MSGVFGIVSKESQTGIEDLLARMGRAMSHRPWYQVDTLFDPGQGIGLGRIGIGIFNAEPQPIVSRDGLLWGCMAGEFYDVGPIRQDLARRGYPCDGASDAELALLLYQDQGPGFVAAVEGIFAIAIWDRSLDRLTLLNDRLGLKPVYYCHFGDRLVFAPEMKGILQDATFRKRLNLTALAEYVRFQQLLGSKTFFEDLLLLDPGTVLSFDRQSGQLARHTYWDWSAIRPLDRALDARELAEEGERLVRRAVARRLERAARPGIFLSGGLDSRAVLAVASATGRPIATITYGHPDSRDARLARRVARAAGTDHHHIPLVDGRWVLEIVDLHLALTEGAHSWIHAHGMSALPQAREWIDVNLAGSAGAIGTMHARPHLYYAPDREALLNNTFRFYAQQHSWPGLTEAEARTLYTPQYRPRMAGLAFESLRAELGRLDGLDIRVQSTAFGLINHERRMNYNFVLFNNSHFENRCPLYDYRLTEWLISLPPEQRASKPFHKAAIHRAAPRLSLIPTDKAYELPTPHRWLREIHSLADRAGRKLARPLGLGYPRLTLNADYETYVRGELWAWAEELLCGERASSRGIFRPEALRSLLDRHAAGREEWTIGKFASIMTFEMFMRRFFDQA